MGAGRIGFCKRIEEDVDSAWRRDVHRAVTKPCEGGFGFRCCWGGRRRWVRFDSCDDGAGFRFTGRRGGGRLFVNLWGCMNRMCRWLSCGAIGIDTLALSRAERDANICKLIRDGIEPAADMSDFPRAEPAQLLAGGIVEGNQVRRFDGVGACDLLGHQLRVSAHFYGFHAKLGGDVEAAEECGVFGDIVCAVRETFGKLYGWNELIVGVDSDSDASASRVAFTCAIRVYQCVLCHRCIVWCVSGIRAVLTSFLADDSCRMPLMESKVILITGAGSGVGRATALKFLWLGWRVVLAGRRIDALLETVTLSGCAAEMAFVSSVDVTDPNQMTALFDAAVELATNNREFFVSSGRRQTRLAVVSWARRCV